MAVYLKGARKILYQMEDSYVQNYVIYLSDRNQVRTAMIRNGEVNDKVFKSGIVHASFFVHGNRSVLLTYNTKGQFAIYRQWYYQLNRDNIQTLPDLSDDVQDLTLSGTSCDRLILTIKESEGECMYQITDTYVTIVDHLLV